MPEYLFKGKRKGNGEWVEGDFVRLKDGRKVMSYIYGKGEVIPSTVCQYTGKNDRKGTKIFNSDRIRFFDEEGTSDYIVKWDAYECRYIIEDEKGCTDGLDGFIAANCEVIDNVHDLPKNHRKAVRRNADKIKHQ